MKLRLKLGLRLGPEGKAGALRAQDQAVQLGPGAEDEAGEAWAMPAYLSSDGQHETSMAAAAPRMRTSASHSSLRPVTAVWLSRRDRVRSSTAAVA